MRKCLRLFAAFFLFLSADASSFSQAVIYGKDSLPVNRDSVYTRVDTRAEFPGGEAARKKFIEKNLDGALPLKNGARSGVYTVLVDCVIDTAGKMVAITSRTHFGYGMEKEVMRVIRKFPRWNPAIKNGVLVKSRVEIPVTFRLFKFN